MLLSGISLETADFLYKWGWRASIFAAVITAISVALLMLGTTVRDRNFETRMSESREKTAILELEAAKIRQTTVGLEIDLEKERTLRVGPESLIVRCTAFVA